MSRIESNTTYVPRMMRMLFPMRGGTLMSVDRNEPVYGVQESYGHAKDGTEHRWQVLLMPRGDHLAGFWWDLGPTTQFLMEYAEGDMRPAPPYFQPILLEHSVAECVEMAEHARMDDFAQRLLKQQISESTLFKDYARLIEQDIAIVKNRSVYGPGGKTQRNGYSAIAAGEQQRRLESIRGY